MLTDLSYLLGRRMCDVTFDDECLERKQHQCWTRTQLNGLDFIAAVCLPPLPSSSSVLPSSFSVAQILGEGEPCEQWTHGRGRQTGKFAD